MNSSATTHRAPEGTESFGPEGTESFGNDVFGKDPYQGVAPAMPQKSTILNRLAARACPSRHSGWSLLHSTCSWRLLKACA